MADLSIGDCFSVVGSGAQQIVQPHGCTQHHTDQLVRLERAAGDDDRFPPDSYWNGPVAKRCEQDVAAFTGLTADRWPLHFAANQFHPVRTGWASGDRTVYCVAEWLRGGGVGTARQLTPRPPQAAITAPDDRTITGVLAELRHGPNSCLALDAGGRRTAIASVDGTYTSGFTTVDGVLDRVHSGLFRGVSTSAALPVRRIGDTVRLTGYFDTDTTGVECGAHTVFRFTGVR
ncbi:MAG: septum formation family protein [Jatrophihabitans sp.]|uniref:septum formation family protein n=1 Tax=Jatrophihabitans sp. TaxID=1932789 RepID=UPI003F7E0040